MDVGDRIKKRRLELNMTQEELAKKLGYKTRGSVTKIESGYQNLTQPKIVAMAKALETTTDYLMGWGVTIKSNSNNYENAINAVLRLDTEEIESIITFAESLIKARNASVVKQS